MLQVEFAVWDEAAASFNVPFFAPTVAAGERLFGDAVNNPESPWNRHPADYTLFEVGITELDTMAKTIHPAPINRGSAMQYKTNPVAVAQPFEMTNGMNRAEHPPVVVAEGDNPHVQEVK